MANNRLPSVVSDIPRDLRAWTERVRESLGELAGAQSALTSTVDQIIRPPGGDGGGGGGGGGGPGGNPPCGTPGYPPAPTGFAVFSAFTGFGLTWDYPDYCGHAYTEVWGARSDLGAGVGDLGQSILLGSSQGTIFSYIVDEFDAYWCFWIRHVNLLGQEGPYNQTGGTCAQTGMDIEYTLDQLKGAITEGQLYKSLSDRIDLIDGDGDGSVNERLDIVNDGLVQQIDTLGLSTVGFDAFYAWNFDINGQAEGWLAYNATATVNAGALYLNATSADPILASPVGLAIPGDEYYLIRARVKRIGGVGWDGTCYYSVEGEHGESGQYYKQIADSTSSGEWVVLEWDMSALTAGDSDWLDSSIHSFRLDLGSSLSDRFTVDWITVGRVAPLALVGAIQEVKEVIEGPDGLLAQQYIKIDIGGHISGYGLSAYAVGGATESEFGIRADRFFVTGPSTASSSPPTTNLYTGRPWYDTVAKVTKYYTGTTWSTDSSYAIFPLIVLTVPTTMPDGVVRGPGVFIDSAYIVSLDAAKITTGVLAANRVNAFNITANSVIAGNVSVSGGAIKSSNFVTGSTGWIIEYDGTAELNNATVRGTVWATNGQFKGTLLNADASSFATGPGLFSGLDGGVYKFRVGSGTASRFTYNYSTGEVAIYNNANQAVLMMSSANNYIKLGNSGYNPDRFVLNGNTQTLTVLDEVDQERVKIGRLGSGASNYGLEVRGSDGDLLLSTGSGLNTSDSANLLRNSDFAADLGYSVYFVSGGGAATDCTLQRDLGGAAYTPFWVHQIGLLRGATDRAKTVYVALSPDTAVIAGKRYSVSIYGGAYRCTVRVFIKFLNASGTSLGEFAGNLISTSTSTNLDNLSKWQRSSLFVTAPANSVVAVVGFIASPATTAGDAVAFATRFYMGEATLGQTQPSPWSPSTLSDLTSLGFPFTSGTIGTYISDLAVVNAKIANLAVNTAKIANLAVNTAKIADLSVTTLKMGDYAAAFGMSGDYPSGVSVSISAYSALGTLSFTLPYAGDAVIIAQAYSTTNIPENGLIAAIKIDGEADIRATQISFGAAVGKTYSTLVGVHGFSAGSHSVQVLARGNGWATNKTIYGFIYVLCRYK